MQKVTKSCRGPIGACCLFAGSVGLRAARTYVGAPVYSLIIGQKMSETREWRHARSDRRASSESTDAGSVPSRLKGAMQFDDPDRFKQHIQQVNAEFTVVGEGRYLAELQIVPAGRVVLQRGWQSSAHVGRISTPQDRCLLLFPHREDQLPSRVANAEVRFNDIFFASAGSQDYHRGAEDTEWSALSSGLDELRTAAEALGECDFDDLGSTQVITPPPPVTLRLLNLAVSVCDLAATAPESLQHPCVGAAVEESLLRAMAACVGSTDRRQRVRSGFGRGATIIRQFEAFLEANADRPVHLTELCTATGVKARALRYWCHEYLGMGPIRYLHLRRMHLARRALIHADPAATSVTIVANDFGFAELGRFAVSYRRIFGESPSATLRRPAVTQPATGIYPSPLRNRSCFP